MDPNGPETLGKVGMFQAHATTVQGIRQPRRPSDSSQFPGYISELKRAGYSTHNSVPAASRVMLRASRGASPGSLVGRPAAECGHDPADGVCRLGLDQRDIELNLDQ